MSNKHEKISHRTKSTDGLIKYKKEKVWPQKTQNYQINKDQL